MKSDPLRSLGAKFRACLKDDRGQAMTEYLIVVGVVLPIACHLYQPDNGLYKALRDQYDLTSLLLLFPGP